MGEQICKDVSKAWATISNQKSSIVCARYANPVGSHESGKLPENPVGTAMNLYAVISEVVTGKRERLSVFGNDYPTRDSSCERDFIHVYDLAEAHVAIITKMLQENSALVERGYEEMNVGTGKGTTVFEMIELMKQKHGKDIPFDIVSRRPGDAASIVVAVDKIEKLIGWKSKRAI